MKRRALTTGTLVFGSVLAWFAVATAAPTAVSGGDKDFILEAASGGQEEVKLGQLAKEKGQSEIVKQFGQHMIDDHGKANDELTGLAGRKGVTVPTELKSKHQKVIDSLTKLSGPDFDKQYMAEMVKDHVADVALFKKEANGGKDAELTTWAKQTLPTLEKHLTMARDADSKVKLGPGKSIDTTAKP